MKRYEIGRQVFCLLFVLLFCTGTGVGQEVESRLIIPRALEGDGIYSHPLALIIDGRTAVPESLWNGESCVFWENEETFFTIDLGRVFMVTGLRVQVDGDDDYQIDSSSDADDFFPLLQAVGAWGSGETGMETWSSLEQDAAFEAGMVFEPVEARYLRIQASGGDSAYGVAEFQVMGYAPSVEEETGDESPAVLLRPASVDGGAGGDLAVDKIIDGIIPPEGSGIHAAEAVFWESGETIFTVDMGVVCEISELLIQVDHDDDYHVDTSIDGENFMPLLEITGDDGEIAEGLDTMSSVGDNPEFVSGLEFFPVSARYIRIYGVRGSSGFALSEVQLFGHPSVEP